MTTELKIAALIATPIVIAISYPPVRQKFKDAVVLDARLAMFRGRTDDPAVARAQRVIRPFGVEMEMLAMVQPSVASGLRRFLNHAPSEESIR